MAKIIKQGDLELTFNYYKEPLLAIPKSKGFGYYGVLLGTVDGQSVQCHICGKLFAALGVHVFAVHNMRKREYKTAFQLAYTTSLSSEVYRMQQKAIYIKWLNKLTPQQREEMRRKMMIASAKGRKLLNSKTQSHPIQLETKNKRGICPDQVLAKIKEVTTKLGRTPSLSEFVDECKTQRYKHLIFKLFGSWKKALKLCDLVPVEPIRSTGKRTKYTNEELLEYLRLFAQETNTVPTATDFRREFLPKWAIYKSHFGSIENARQLAGVYDIVPKPAYTNSWRKGRKYVDY